MEKSKDQKTLSMGLCRALTFLLLFFTIGNLQAQSFEPSKMEELLYGVAYYYEYMPEERLEKDIRLMKECGINMVRICESTWSYLEPHDNTFNLAYVTRILDAMYKNDIKVIVGTPTYAIPAWMAKKHPEILVTTKEGQKKYGARQIMDITNKDYRFYSERIIRKLIGHVHGHPAVIGFQVDNETKHYGTAGENVQQLFKQYLKNKFKTPEAMNRAFGLHYWSNSIFDWDDMPSTVGTINASLQAEFDKFQRQLVTDFLAWQVSIVNEYKKPHQFVTQNFDLDWRGMSYAIQSDVDHFEASKPFDIAGIDIYHETAENLDGVVIGLAGDLARSMKSTNYLVVETQAQSINPPSRQYLPFPGQLRLQAYSHIANGANMVAYWPWHSIHNSAETYWKGLLSHDLMPNPTFNEAKQIASEFKSIGNKIMNLQKDNKVAIYFSNESLTAIKHFPIHDHLDYNDVVRQLYDLLYKTNIECDFIDHSSGDIEKYDVIIVPPLYSASDGELRRLMDFAANGGHVLFCFKSGFSDEHLQVRTVPQPGLISEAVGASYQQFTTIDKLPLLGNSVRVDATDNYVSHWAELLVPKTSEVIAKYDHPYWNTYAALVKNSHEKGSVTYMGSWPSPKILKEILLNMAKTAKVQVPDYQFPIIIRKGTNTENKTIRYLFNYSDHEQTLEFKFNTSTNLLTNKRLNTGDTIKIQPWDLIICREN